MASCDASCEASCSGSCEVDKNFDCQLQCQGEGQVDCEAEVAGGCEAECKTHEGALFCEGQYVDHGDDLDECVAALRAKFNVQIEAEADGESGCDAGVCSASGNAGVKACSVSHPGHAASSYASYAPPSRTRRPGAANSVRASTFHSATVRAAPHCRQAATVRFGAGSNAAEKHRWHRSCSEKLPCPATYALSCS